MKQIARHGKMTAREGKTDELAGLMLAAAEEMRSDPGCELYLINRQADQPDAIWVTELWRSQDDLDAAVERIRGSDDVAAVMELVADGEMIELELLGGKGAGENDGGDSPEPYTIANLTDVEDSAARYGMESMGEARFANDDLATAQTGVSHHTLPDGTRQQFAHRHGRAEEVYVVIGGSGRVKLDDDVVEIGERDAIRVSPGVIRAFEGGTGGLEILAFGPRTKGDGEMLPGWWSD